MNGFELVASLAGSLLSWPVAAVVIVVVLHSPIGDLLERIVHGEFFGTKFDAERTSKRADERADQAAEEVNEEIAESSETETATPGSEVAPEGEAAPASPEGEVRAPAEPETPDTRLRAKTERWVEAAFQSVSPIDRELDVAWLRVGGAIQDLYSATHPEMAEAKGMWLKGVARLLDQMIDEHILPTSFGAAWHDLALLNRQRRRDAAELSVADARRFLSAAQELETTALRVLRNQTKRSAARVERKQA